MNDYLAKLIITVMWVLAFWLIGAAILLGVEQW